MKKEWGRFEFDFELDGNNYIQGISFEIISPESFSDIICPYLKGTVIEEESFWFDIVDSAVKNEWSEICDLKIKNIKID